MYTLGIDIGSASSKVVILHDGKEIVSSAVVSVGTGTSGPDRALEAALLESKLDLQRIDRIIATGYGRNNYEKAHKQVSEITCHAKGVLHLIPTAKTIIDIGGQDAKVIRVSGKGLVSNFVMNEKCAAGTGRFLEVMSRVLEVDINDMGKIGQASQSIVPISSTCTVFAESEVISQLASGQDRAGVVAGIHQSVAKRIAGLAARLGILPDVVMTGGVAKNPGVVEALKKELKTNVIVSPISQLTGALGAAIIAYEDLLQS